MVIRRISIDIDETVYHQALVKASTQGHTLSQVMETLLTEWSRPTPESVAGPDVPPAPTAPDVPTAPTSVPALVTRIYEVKSGDTLGAIAREMYGSAAKYNLIAEANNITDPRRIWVGQVLTIPALPGEEKVATPSQPQTPEITTPPPNHPHTSYRIT